MAKRRKYRFADRATAEDTLAAVEQQSAMIYQCFRRYLLGEVAAEFRRGDYWARVVGLDSPAGPYVVLVFNPGGQFSLEVLQADEWSRGITSTQRRGAWEHPGSVAADYVAIADDVSAWLHRLAHPQTAAA